jgi:hypothetical protein
MMIDHADSTEKFGLDAANLKIEFRAKAVQPVSFVYSREHDMQSQRSDAVKVSRNVIIIAGHVHANGVPINYGIPYPALARAIASAVYEYTHIHRCTYVRTYEGMQSVPVRHEVCAI